MKSISGVGLLCLLLLFWTPTPAASQAGYSEVSGEVRDPTGAVIAKAEVTAKGTQTGEIFRAQTTSAGFYLLSNLRPGRYSVSAVAPGFRQAVREDVQLNVGDRERLDFAMVVGPASEQVTVTSQPAGVNTETSGLSQVIDHQSIVNLPLNGRNFISLVPLSPNVALPPGSSFPRINGGRPRTNEYLYDGISVLQPEPGQVAFPPVIDAIQEFNVQTSNISAEFGRFNGGVVNLTTRAGTNTLHGTAWEFLRNEALNARNYFAPPNQPKPTFRRNQFGFLLGGPIIRDKAFYFVDYQGTLQSIGQTRISTVPTNLQRQGIFTEPISGKVATIYDPNTTKPIPGGFTRSPFSGNAIPSQRMDPVALELLGRYPLPNLPGTANNYRRVANEDVNQQQFDARVDHRFSSNNLLYGRYTQFRDDSLPATPLPQSDGLLSTGVIGNTATRASQAMGHYVHMFGGTMANDLAVGYTSRSVNRDLLQLDQPPSQSLGLPGIPTNGAFDTALPIFNIVGLQQLGPTSNANSNLKTAVIEATDAFSLVRGRHSLKFGADLRWERLNITQPPSPTGQFRFSTLFTDLPGKAGTGNSLASFLLGQVETFSIDIQGKQIQPRASIQEYYVQDDWKATSRLTINAGLRYTLNFPSTEATNQGAVFDLKSQQLNYLGVDGNSRAARELNWLDFGPRIGIAYQLHPATVLRGGYGLIWFEQAGITTPFTTPQFPFLQSVGQRTLDNINPAFVLQNGPSVSPIPLTPDAGLGQGVFSVDPSRGSGYSQQWNMAVQHQFSSTVTIELGYSGNKITNLGVPDVNLNQLTVDQLAIGAPLLKKVPNPYFGQIPRSSSLGDPTITTAQLLKPYPRFTNVSLYRNNVGGSSYDSLRARAEKQFSRGLSLLVSYTWSHLIDDASSVFDASVLTGPIANYPVADSFNRRLERDSSTGDIPQVFVLSYTYDFPMGRGHNFAPSGIAGRLVSGWSMSGVLTLQSGMPFPITQATNFNAFAGFGVQRPNEVASPSLASGQRSVTSYFNTAAFTVAPQFTLGNTSRNPVRGPGYQDFDFALVKNSILTERLNIDFRAEIFNLANTPSLGQPAGVLGNPGFGSITTTASDPRVVQFGLKFNF